MPLSNRVRINRVEVKKNGKWDKMATGEIDSYYYLATGLENSFEIKFVAENGKEIIYMVNNPAGGQTINTGQQF